MLFSTFHRRGARARMHQMNLGVISDVHADRVALERALSLLVDRGADKIVCLGDVVEKGPDGDGTIEVLRDWLIPAVRGNHDDNAVRHAALEPALRGSEPPLSARSLAWLDGLPDVREYHWLGQTILLAHGTPTCRNTYVFPEQVPKRLKRTLRAAQFDVLLLGHTHRPMRMRYGDLWICNPGSVCKGRARDSHTCGLLSLPDRSFQVFDVGTGDPVEVPVTTW